MSDNALAAFIFGAFLLFGLGSFAIAVFAEPKPAGCADEVSR
jgi:hypothetical protein